MAGSNRNSSSESDQGQIPYSLYAAAREPSAQRRRWVVETVLGILIVIGLAAIGYIGYQKFSSYRAAQPAAPSQSSGTKASAPKTKTPESLSQPPQQNGHRLPGAQQPASSGKAAKSTNRRAIAPPKN